MRRRSFFKEPICPRPTTTSLAPYCLSGGSRQEAARAGSVAQLWAVHNEKLLLPHLPLQEDQQIFEAGAFHLRGDYTIIDILQSSPLGNGLGRFIFVPTPCQQSLFNDTWRVLLCRLCLLSIYRSHYHEIDNSLKDTNVYSQRSAPLHLL